MLLYDLFSDIIKIDNVLLIVKNNGVVSEIRAPNKIKQKEKWITIGENDDPAHMHINSELIKSAKFIQEEKPERVSYSIISMTMKKIVSLQLSLQKCMMIPKN